VLFDCFCFNFFGCLAFGFPGALPGVAIKMKMFGDFAGGGFFQGKLSRIF